MTPPILPGHSRDLAEIDTVLDRAIAAGDPLIATSHGNELSKSMAAKGVALAKLFYGMRNNWSLFRVAGIGEDFKDFVDAHMVVKGSTADKYANMYESVFVQSGISEELQRHLAGKPMKSLLLLTAAVREGSISDEQLEDVVVLSHEGIRNLVKESRGDATSSRSAAWVKWVQREDSRYAVGALVAFGGDGESEVVGFLKPSVETDAGKKIVERIRNRLELQDIR